MFCAFRLLLNARWNLSEEIRLTDTVTPSEALELSLFMRGRIDMSIICSRTGLSPAEAYDKLVGLLYYDPDEDRLVPAAEYLSGNVLKS